MYVVCHEDKNMNAMFGTEVAETFGMYNGGREIGGLNSAQRVMLFTTACIETRAFQRILWLDTGCRVYLKRAVQNYKNDPYENMLLPNVTGPEFI